MPLTDSQRAAVARELDITLRDRHQWPTYFEKLFLTVKKLGTTDYPFLDDGKGAPHHDSRHAVKDLGRAAQRIRERVRQLTRKTRYLRDHRHNKSEMDWRTKIEDILFQHFDYDVLCRCGHRVWVSCLDPSADRDREESLLLRQKERKYCNCRNQECEPSKIFGSRSEAYMKLDRDLMAQLEKKGERPDKCYGLLKAGTVLKCTERLPKLSRLRTTPFHCDDTESIFPFLLCEAKSSVSGKSKGEIELQIFFQLREMLLVQNSLATKSDGGDAAFHPLVWGLTYAGEDVHLLAAGLRWTSRSTNSSKGHYCTDVFRLWHGDLCEEEEAYRCLSILDFIIDWGRDIYRPNVIQQLKSMAEIPYEPEISGSRSRPRSVLSWCGSEGDGEEEASDASVSPTKRATGSLSENIDSLRQRSNDEHTYRDARFVRSRILGLFVTKETLQRLRSSRANTHTAAAFISRIAIQLEKHAKKDALFEMTGGTLFDLEETWVGEVCGSRLHSTQQFLVSLTFSAYMSPTWEPTRELAYIAVAKNTISTILKDRAKRSTNLFAHSLGKDSALALLRKYRSTSLTGQLSLCLQRCSIIPTARKPTDQPLVKNVLDKHRARPLWMIPDVSYKPRNFVWNIFKGHHKEEGENCSKSYLRLGAALQEHRAPRYQPHNGRAFFPELKLTTLEPFVLAFHRNGKLSNWCVFWLNEDRAENPASVGELEAAMPVHFYSTQRHGPSAPWHQITWNEKSLNDSVVKTDAQAIDCLRKFCVTVQHDPDTDYLVAELAKVRLGTEPMPSPIWASLVS